MDNERTRERAGYDPTRSGARADSLRCGVPSQSTIAPAHLTQQQDEVRAPRARLTRVGGSLRLVCSFAHALLPVVFLSVSVLPLSPSVSPLLGESALVSGQDFMVCFVNGKKYELHARDFQPETTLLHFLRTSQSAHCAAR